MTRSTQRQKSSVNPGTLHTLQALPGEPIGGTVDIGLFNMQLICQPVCCEIV